MVNISGEIVQDDFSIVDLGGENGRLERLSTVAAQIVILDVIGFNLDKKVDIRSEIPSRNNVLKVSVCTSHLLLKSGAERLRTTVLLNFSSMLSLGFDLSPFLGGILTPIASVLGPSSPATTAATARLNKDLDNLGLLINKI